MITPPNTPRKRGRRVISMSTRKRLAQASGAALGWITANVPGAYMGAKAAGAAFDLKYPEKPLPKTKQMPKVKKGDVQGYYVSGIRHTKQKVIKHNPTKFEKKVQKVLNKEKVVCSYRYQTGTDLYPQGVNNTHKQVYVTQDKKAFDVATRNNLTLDDTLSLIDAYSILYGNKVVRGDFTNQVGNTFTNDQAISLADSYMTFKFSSCSVQPIQVKMVTCICKADTDEHPYDTYVKQLAGLVPPANGAAVGMVQLVGTDAASAIGASPLNVPELNEKWAISIDQFIVQPGQYLEKMVRGTKNRMLHSEYFSKVDTSFTPPNESFPIYSKYLKTKVVFFIVHGLPTINLINATENQYPTYAGLDNTLPSGGISVIIDRVYKIRQPNWPEGSTAPLLAADNRKIIFATALQVPAAKTVTSQLIVSTNNPALGNITAALKD